VACEDDLSAREDGPQERLGFCCRSGSLSVVIVTMDLLLI
jgi:hypothetical protein